MSEENRYLFVSYAREDLPRVEPFVNLLRVALQSRVIPIELWMDVSNLQPGERWDIEISRALESAVGFLYFLSPQSLKSRWVIHELQAAATAGERLIIPIILYPDLDLPAVIAQHQWLDLSGSQTQAQLQIAALQVARTAEDYLLKSPAPKKIVSEAEAPQIAATIAQGLRDDGKQADSPNRKNSIFVVHGHDHSALVTIENFLYSIGVEPVVLSRQTGSTKSLFHKFMTVANEARFAVVLFGADDYGASREQYESDGVSERALQFRARQNVIMELGFFYGKLGWENVLVLQVKPEKVFPNFERPSDLDGVVFDSMSDESWQQNLTSKLSDAGFEVLTSA